MRQNNRPVNSQFPDFFRVLFPAGCQRICGFSFYIRRLGSGDNSPRDHLAVFDEFFNITGIKDKFVEIGVRVKTDNIRGRVENQGPVRIGTDMNTGKSAFRMNRGDYFFKTGRDFLIGNADKFR